MWTETTLTIYDYIIHWQPAYTNYLTVYNYFYYIIKSYTAMNLYPLVHRLDI